MKVCTNCGHANDDDAQFCEACQDYLWAKEPEKEKVETAAVAAPTVAEPAEAPAGEAVATGCVAAEKPVEVSVGGGSATAGVTADEPLVAAAAPVVEPPAPPPDAPAPHADAPAPPDEPPAPQDDAPVAVLPGQQYEPPPPERPVDEPEPEPGELICDQCGKGNRAEANFCRRCGASLAEARVAERPPWWRRIFVRPGKTYAAGERRRGSKATAKTGVAKARRGIFQVSRALAILAILGIVSIGAWRGDLTGRVNDWYHSARVAVFPHYDRVGPAKVRASSALGVHRVGRAFDRSFATYWQAAPEVAKGQSLTAYFDPKVDIARIGITLGNKDKPNPALVVPHRVRVRLFANGRRVASKVLFLKNTPDFQRFSIDGNGVTKAVIRIQSAFPNRQVRHHHVTLTEVEYFEEN